MFSVSKVDIDKNGRLSCSEMLENPYVFYSSVFADEEDECDYHAKLRWNSGSYFTFYLAFFCLCSGSI